MYELIYNVVEGANGYFVEVSHAIFNYRIGERDGQQMKKKSVWLMCHHKDGSNRYMRGV